MTMRVPLLVYPPDNFAAMVDISFVRPINGFAFDVHETKFPVLSVFGFHVLSGGVFDDMLLFPILTVNGFNLSLVIDRILLHHPLLQVMPFRLQLIYLSGLLLVYIHLVA